MQTSLLPSHALGLGLRLSHYATIRETLPPLDYFEIISENFMSSAAPPQDMLRFTKQHYPIVLHGVGLNLLGHEALDLNYLEALKQLADQTEALFVTDHLCWSSAHGIRHHDLLPTPFTSDLIAYAAERAAFVQEYLKRPFGLENLSSYLTFPESQMSEWDFYTQVVKTADISYMLDINNIYVSSQNHGFDPRVYIDAIDFSRVLQVHLAGHQRQDSALIIDTHDQKVADEVWQLYRYAWERGGPFPTLLEWDDKIPPLAEVIEELMIARRFQS